MNIFDCGSLLNLYFLVCEKYKATTTIITTNTFTFTKSELKYLQEGLQRFSVASLNKYIVNIVARDEMMDKQTHKHIYIDIKKYIIFLIK